MKRTILLLPANPKDISRLDLDKEFREIQDRLRRSRSEGMFILHPPQQIVDHRELTRALEDYHPDIVHFSGRSSEYGNIILEDNLGQSTIVSPEALANLFGLFPLIECVVLDGCYSRVQAEAIAQHVDYVIGMTKNMNDDAVFGFYLGFYDALGAGQSIPSAFKFGCSKSKMENNSEDIPILLTRSEIEEDSSVKALRDKIERLRNDPSRGQITLSIPGDLNAFTSKQLDDLITTICVAAGIDPDEVFLQNVSSGSVRVTLELSEEAARKIVHDLEKKHSELTPYSITIEHQFQARQQHNGTGKKVILCLAAEPSDTIWLQLGKEHKEIFEALTRAIYGDHFMLQQIWAAKARDVLRYLLYYRPAIVHFSGHGTVNGALLFEDSQGACHHVEPHALSALFSGLKGDTRCVVLNSCYSHIQAEQISCHVDCVVGIEGEIENMSALAFASAFYETIASGRSVKEAYILAQAELIVENLNGSKQVKLVCSKGVNPNDVKFILSKAQIGSSPYP